jgi:hypothetical protein
MKTLTVAAIAIMAALLAVPAYSQSVSGRQVKSAPAPPVDTVKKKADDKAYNDTLSRIPAKEYDPWQGVREKAPAPPKKTSR